MNRRAFGAACLVLVALCLLTVALNSWRWTYYGNGIVRVDRWSGKGGLVEGDATVVLLDTGKWVFSGAGAILAVGWLIGMVAKKGSGERTPRETQ